MAAGKIYLGGNWRPLAPLVPAGDTPSLPRVDAPAAKQSSERHPRFFRAFGLFVRQLKVLFLSFS